MPPKKKQEKMSLGNFLSDQNYGSWAEEMDEMPLPSTSRSERPSYGSERREYAGYSRQDPSERGPPREQLPLPTRPPFTAHLGNLSFDVTMADVEDYFAGCDVTNVRIVEDKIERKPKGFGYVEFGTLDGLKKALDLNGTQFQGRNIRVSVAEPPKDREPAREFNDWTRKGPLPELPANTRRPSGRGGYEGPGSDAGSERATSRRGYEADNRVRDFGNWERKGPLSPAATTPTSAGPGPEAGRPRRSDKPFDRRASPSWGEGRSQDEGRPPPRSDSNFQERPPVSREPTAAELDNQWRSKMRPDAPSQTPTPDTSVPSSPAPVSSVPNTRPRLNLQKRTVSAAVEADTEQAAGAADAKASPFGAARPIDTAAREREVVEKRQAERKKREEEDKEREVAAKAEREKAAAEAATSGATPPTAPSKASGTSRLDTSSAATRGGANLTSPRDARSPRSPRSPRVNGRTASSNFVRGESFKRNEVTSPTTAGANGAENGDRFTPRAGFSILSHEGDAEDPTSVETGTDGRNMSANGEIIDTDAKDVKPALITRDIGAGPGAESETPTAEALEDDGFQTVVRNSAKPGRGKNRPRGGGRNESQGTRAFAS